MQKTLIIHPEDKSTDFLSEIYSGMNCTLIRDNSTCNEEIIECIKNHDKIIMMGHGCPSGLFRIGRKELVYMIDKSHVSLLKEKSNNIFIWCNADLFVRSNNLKGFYTGMIISEMIEAFYFNIIPRKIEVRESNELFSSCIKKSINLEPSLMCENVKSTYKTSNNNPIILYNQQNIYHL